MAFDMSNACLINIEFFLSTLCGSEKYSPQIDVERGDDCFSSKVL
jgi:hypothetical protein